MEGGREKKTLRVSWRGACRDRVGGLLSDSFCASSLPAGRLSVDFGGLLLMDRHIVEVTRTQKNADIKRGGEAGRGAGDVGSPLVQTHLGQQQGGSSQAKVTSSHAGVGAQPNEGPDEGIWAHKDGAVEASREKVDGEAAGSELGAEGALCSSPTPSPHPSIQVCRGRTKLALCG